MFLKRNNRIGIVDRRNTSIFPTIVVFALGVLTSSVSLSNQDSFNRAVNVYNKGFAECVSANLHRESDIEEAKKKFAIYRKYKNEATLIDKSIVTSDERSMNKNIKYCEKVYVNLLRAESTPFLTDAFEYCASAKAAIEEGNLVQSTELIAQYRELKAQAFDITRATLDVFSISSQMRQCTRIEKRIAQIEETQNQYAGSSQALIDHLAETAGYCDHVRKGLKNSKAPLKSLASAERLLETTESTLLVPIKFSAAIDLAIDYPDRENSQKIIKLQQNHVACINNLTAATQQASIRTERMIQRIKTDLATAELALSVCDTVSNRLDTARNDSTQLDAVSGPLREVQKLVRSVETFRSYSDAKRYPHWPMSKQLLNAVAETKKCEASSSQIYVAAKKVFDDDKARKAVVLQKQEQQKRARKVLAANKLKEKQRRQLAQKVIAEEKAKREAVQQMIAKKEAAKKAVEDKKKQEEFDQLDFIARLMKENSARMMKELRKKNKYDEPMVWVSLDDKKKVK